MEQMKEVVTQLRKDGVEIEKPGVEEQKFQNVKDEEQPYCSKATPKIVKKEKKDKKKKRKESPKESIKDEPEAPFLHFKFKDASNSTSSTEPPIVNDEENSSRSDRPSTYQIFSQKQKKAEKKRRIQFEQLLQSEPLWAKNKLTLTKNGYVQRDGFGQKIRFSEFKKVAKEYPWTMFLYDYVVDCLKCGDEVTMETLDHDGCSVKCSRPGCNAVTLLGTHKKGQMFVCHYQCWHYNQIPFEEDDICRGMCPTCGEDGPFCPGYDEDVRFPRVKDESPSTSSAEPSF